MTTTTLPKTQKAILFNTQSNTLSLSSSHPIHTDPDQHLIKVHTTAITNGELTWAPFVNWPANHIPCYDVTGTILTPVAGSQFHPGDIVYGRISAAREGAACQYANILPSECAKVPRGLSLVDAVTVPMSALTAWQALFEKAGLGGGEVPGVDDDGNIVGGDLARGKRVLILGAAGGVGSIGIQFAKLAGAEVVGTASGRNEGFLRELGCGDVVDYTVSSVEAYVNGQEERKFDIVFDCVGGSSMVDGWFGVREHGVYVSVVPGFKEPEHGKPRGVRMEWFVMVSRGEELEHIGRFLEKGLVRCSPDSVWRLEEFEEAFRRTGTRHARGKVVLRVKEVE